ncbi:hypothetical protein VTN02DRAFT_3004 [Thermoascus thermophilus]
MADQQSISQILAALAAQQPGGITGQTPLGHSGPGTPASGLFPTSTVLVGKLNSPLPPPDSTGSLNLSGVKPVSTGSVNIVEAIDKTRSITSDKVQSRGADTRASSRSYHRSRSPSRSPPRITRNSFRDNYNPYRDERRDGRGGSDRGYIRDRSFSPRAGARRRSSPLPARAYAGGEVSPRARGGGDDNSETIPVDSKLVGLIIGRQGENLRRVEAETGARVQFLNGPEAAGSTRLCRISGSRASRNDAKAELDRIIGGNGGLRSDSVSLDWSERGPPKFGSQPMRESDNAAQIMVPDKTVGLIIGRGGETIRDLQERSGCHINIVGESKSVNGLRPVNLIGCVQAAQRAKDLILEIVESDTRLSVSQVQRDGTRGGPPASGDDSISGVRVNDAIFVPGETIGMIIGKGGETVREMQNISGCKINVQPPFGRDAEREIQLVGSRNAIEQAKTVIMNKINSVEPKNRASGLRREEEYSNLYSQTQQFHTQQDHSQTAQQSADDADPYAIYGGYQNYVAMWYASMAQQQHTVQKQQSN